jgi:hypothetical protein
MLRVLQARVTRQWPLKLGLSLLLPVVFCAAYFGLQRHPLLTPGRLPPTALDERIGFDPRWVYAYQSVYLLMAVAWLATSATILSRYLRGFALLSLASFACFLAMPAIVPRPGAPAHGLYAVLVSYDAPLNTFPSLHVGLATYSVLFARTPLDLPARACLVLALWASLIAYAALAIKQHYVLDLPPAIVLAFAAHRYAVRSTTHERRP